MQFSTCASGGGGVDMTYGVVHVWGVFSELIFKDSL